MATSHAFFMPEQSISRVLFFVDNYPIDYCLAFVFHEGKQWTFHEKVFNTIIIRS